MAKYEVIVIGSGPAGLSAAIYLGRAQISTLVVGKKSQSQLIKAHNIQNYFGFPDGIPGKDLLELGIKQAKKFGAQIIDNEVVDAEKTKTGFKIKLANHDTHTAKALVFATGTPIKLSGILNEENFTGKGLHYCVECDGPFYQKKKVAIVGNSNHAAEDALDMMTYTKNITIISNADSFSFSPQYEQTIQQNKIKLLNEKINAFNGKIRLESLELESKKTLVFDGVFMACGTASALDFSSKLALQIDENILEVDESNKTSVDGVFAAGNCCARCRQVANNVGEGCNAALSAIKFLRQKILYVDYGSLKK